MANRQTEKEAFNQDFLSSASVSEWDLKNIGVGDVAYIKSYTVSGKTAYVLHAADGSVIDAESSQHDAIKNAHFQDLNLVSVN